MKPSALLLVGMFGCVCSAWAADATSTIDYRDRNGTFAPSPSVAPQKQTPATNAAVQEKRVEKTTVEKQMAPMADRRAGVDVKETREKSVREKDSRRPQTIEQPTSAFNHRTAAMSTSADTTKPPIVSKYQDGLIAASASNMARFPAMDGATTAKINRFVFRKNAAEPAAGVNGSPVTPAAGGAVVGK